MIELFQKYIKEKELFTTESYVIAAVSGGLDSVCLCHLLHTAGYKFAIAHCNFGLRGAESDQDQEFVSQLAQKYQVSFFNKSFSTTTFAEEEKMSIQMAARKLRYDWFYELATQQNADKILTAHHKSDIAETLLLNLSRGTGIAGLHGIRPNQGLLARPLLFASRDDLQTVVNNEQLKWREDRSNESPKYKRNFIRHKIIPLFKEINPNFENTLESTIEKIALTEAVFDEQIEVYKKQYLSQNHDHWKLTLDNWSDKIQAPIILYELLKPFNFSYEQCKSIVSVLSQNSGRIIESNTHKLVKDRTSLIITVKNPAPPTLYIEHNTETLVWENQKLVIQKFDAKTYKINPDKNIAAFDLDTLTFPLELRTWQQGDWFVPLGMKNRKKISDFMIDSKIPLNLKDYLKVISNKTGIIWIVGQRLDDRFKIRNNTKNILELRLTF
jgi:tRNA(Ile)-lysidine synthase